MPATAAAIIGMLGIVFVGVGLHLLVEDIAAPAGVSLLVVGVGACIIAGANL